MAKISSIDCKTVTKCRLILQTFKFTIYSIIVHYKHRVPQLIRTGGGTKKFFTRFAREFTILYPPIMELVAPPLGASVAWLLLLHS